MLPFFGIFPISTDRTIQENLPDIIIKDRKINICLYLYTLFTLFELLFSSLSPYLWQHFGRCTLRPSKTVPFVVGVLGLLKKGTQEQSNKIPSAPSLQEIKENNSKMHNPYAKSFVYLSFLFSVHSCLLFKW